MSEPRPPLSPVQWPAWLGIGIGWLIAHLPWSLARGLAPGLGWLMRKLMRSRRNAVEVNLALCFPELDATQREQLLRENFHSLGMSVFEFLRAWWGPLAPLDRGFVVEGLEHVERAHAGGHGVLLISPHFTTLEICTRLLCAFVPISGMYRPHDSAALDWAVRKGRLGHARQMFPRDALRPAIRHLKDGGVLWFAPDQETRRGESVFVPFFGHLAWSLTSTHAMARLGAARVLPLFLERLPDGRYRVEIGAPLEDFPSSDAHADTARVMAMVEGLVRRAPAQYLWVHKRFKTRPDGQPSPYG